MPSISASAMCLRRVVAGRADVPERFAADEFETIPFAALAASQEAARRAAELRGATVLVAPARQIETIAALIHLDGVAARIVLWPQDRPRTQIDSVAQAAGVDRVITSWPLHGAENGVADGRDAGEADIATEWVLFTSGTTNQPKMVVHTLESLSGHLWQGVGTMGGAVWCTFYDIRRYGGLQVALRALFSGCSLVLSGAGGEMPADFLARAGRAGVTHILGTPSHWRRALMGDAAGLISPRYVRLSGEVADQMILDRLRGVYPQAQIVHAFASTEAGLAFEVSDGLAGFPAELIGRAGTGSLRVKDGILQLSSPRNAAGYLYGMISAVRDEDGFVDTGDVVELRDGRYYFAGRRDGVVNVGGQKVHPEEIEAVINRHPDVHMSLVASRPNPITGAVVVAHVVPRHTDGGQLGLAEDIRRLCRQHLPPHKVPATIRVVAQLDVAPSGKLVRAGA